MWTPVNFDAHVAFSQTNDDAYGHVQEFDDVSYDFTWRPNGRVDTLTCRFAGES